MSEFQQMSAESDEECDSTLIGDQNLVPAFQKKSRLKLKRNLSGEWRHSVECSVDEKAYMNAIRITETEGGIQYFTDYERPYDSDDLKYGSDEFGHLPYKKSYDISSASDATLSTPPEELLEPMSGYRGMGEYTKICYDVSGGGFVEANTRHLSEIGRAAIALYEKLPEMRFLDLGAGAGVAAGEVSTQNNAVVDTVALCPTSPFDRLTMTHCEIYKELEKRFKDAEWTDLQAILEKHNVDEQSIVGVKRLFFIITRKGSKELISQQYQLKTKIAFALHALFPEIKIFASTNDPYIRNQYIGRFPNEVEIPETYQVIHDDNGPMWHESRIISKGNSWPDETIRKLIFGTYHLLADNGALICKRFESNAANMSGLEELNREMRGTHLNYSFYRENCSIGRDGLHTNLPAKDDLILIGTGNNPSLVLAKSKSPIARIMRKILKLQANQGGVFTVDDLLGKLHETQAHTS